MTQEQFLKNLQVPCLGVVSHFKASREELVSRLVGVTPISDYLARATITCMDEWAKDDFWTNTLHDVAAVAWLLNDNERFMMYDTVPVRLPSDDGFYGEELADKKMGYVFFLERDPLMRDLFAKLTRER